MLVFQRGSRLLSNAVKRCYASFPDQSFGQENEHNLEPKKSLRIAIVGLPNTGKSTLINQLVHRPVCAASSKVHTTRVNAFAVYTENNTQLVFIDTPGLMSKEEVKKFKFVHSFNNEAQESMSKADIIGIMQDMQVPNARVSISKRVLSLVSHAKKDTPFILILNKVDLVKKKEILLEVVQNLTENHKIMFEDIFMLSALKKDGVDDLRNYFLDKAKDQDWDFSEDTYTNQKPEEIIERIIKAKLLDNMRQEVPYKVEVKVVHVDYDDAKNLVVIVELKPTSKRHVGMLVGEKGLRIRIICLQAEQDLCSVFHTGVTLKIEVVRPGDK